MDLNPSRQIQAYLLSSRPARPYNLRARRGTLPSKKKGIKEKAAPKQENLDFRASLNYIAKLNEKVNTTERVPIVPVIVVGRK